MIETVRVKICATVKKLKKLNIKNINEKLTCKFHINEL